MLAAPLLTLSLLLAQAEAPSPEAIAAAVRNLSADEFQDREKASEFLWRAGPAALAALEKAATADDFETKFRAKSLLDKVRYGITPETPAEVARLLESFRKGDVSIKINIVRNLKNQGEAKIIQQLLRVEKDPQFQRVASELYRQELDRQLPQFIVKQDFAQVEQVLIQNAATDTTAQRLATFWVLRGAADAQVTKLQESLKKQEDPNLRRQLVWLQRAKGDLSEAASSAQKLADPESLEAPIALAIETRDWKRVLQLEQQQTSPVVPPPIELSRQITWHRLAGMADEVDKDAAELKKLAAADPQNVWLAAKSLLLNERPADGIDLLAKEIPDIAFHLLAYRSDFDAALKLAGAEPGTVFNRDWYNRLPSQERTTMTINIHRYTYAADVMRQLYWLGRKEDAASLRKLLLEIADEPDSRNLNGRVTLAAMELRAGMDEEALEDASLALHQPGGRAILARYFPKQFGYASLWWDFLRKEYPDKSSRETLLNLQQLLRTSPKQGPLPGWEAIVEKGVAHARTLDPPHSGQWLQMMAETADLQGNRDLALTYAKEATQGLPVSGYTLGRLLADDKQHDASAAAYLKVWETDLGHVAALHLAGKSLIAAGKAEAGKQKLEMASLLSLDAGVRRNFAFNLHERGFSDDALPHYELAVRTGQADTWHISNAAENIGNLIVKREPLRAADLWEQLQIYLLQPAANPSEFEPLLDIGRLIHKTRAVGFAQAGKKEEALAEMKLCEQISPGNLDLAEDLIPLFKAKGFAAEAAALYERAYAVHAPLAEKYPASPPLRNNIAWLLAISHQRLDEALSHAQKAVELSPKSPSYLDTLAEVHFQKGDRPKAVEYGKQVLSLAPANKLFAERLKHFENDPLPK